MDQSILDTRGLENRSKLFYLLHEQEVVLLLAFIGGYVDVAGYIKLCGLFTSSITGNFVSALASVTHSDGLATRICVCLFFILGGMVSMIAANKVKKNGLYNPFYYFLSLFDKKKMVLVSQMNLENKNKILDETEKTDNLEKGSEHQSDSESDSDDYVALTTHKYDSLTQLDLVIYNILEYFPKKSRYYLGHGSISAMLFTFEALAIFWTMFLGLCLFPDGSNGDSLTDSKVFFVAIFMGFSMGIHNAAAKECLPWIPATTVLTMTSVSISLHLGHMATSFLAYYGLLDLYSKNPKYGFESEHYFSIEDNTKQTDIENDGGSSSDEDSVVEESNFDQAKYKEELMVVFWDNWTKFERTFRPMVAFLLGALLGAIIMDASSYWGLLLPLFFSILIVYDLYLRIHYEKKQEEEIKEADAKAKVEKISSVVTITPFSDHKKKAEQEIDLDESLIDQEIERNDKILEEIKKDLNSASV